MINKRAKCAFTEIEEINSSENDKMVKTASSGLNTIGADANNIIQAEMKKHPTALFFRAKAIVADETNANGDYFSTDELKRSYATFVGVPFFTNHNNQNVEDARGKLIYSEWSDKDKSVYVIGFVDREAYPHICRGIEEDYMRGVSMGCSVEYSVCSICKNKASTPEEYCNHIKFKKGRKFSGTAKDVNTGELKTFKEAQVYEENYGIKFIELSGVADPACKTCKISDVYDNKQAMQKAASVYNNISMYKESSIYKEASQEDVDQLNQVLKTLEEISVKLIQNRQNVDVEFASDLVKILSELQEFSDELVGAGYAQVQDVQGAQIPGVDQQQEVAPEAQPPTDQAVAQPQAQQIGLETGGITPSVSGAPNKPMAASPNMPTAPVKPIAETISSLKKVANRIIEGINIKGEDDNMRRLPKTVESQKHNVMNVLEKSLKEKEQLAKYNKQDFNNDNGGEQMSQKVASRQDGKEVITEKQLEDQKGGYHPREDSPKTEITQSQLEEKRKNDEKEVTTEKQLDSSRKNDEKEVITQKQLDPKRTEEEKTQVTQGQLKDEGYKTNEEIEVITEKQLDTKTDFWKRSAFGRKDVKTAADHVKDVSSVLAEVAIDTSSTPEQIVLAVKDSTGSIKAKAMLLSKITEEKSQIEKEIISSSSRVQYWGKKGIKIASMTKEDLQEAITSKLTILVANDSKIDPEAIVEVLDAMSDAKDESISRIAATIDSKLAEDGQKGEVKSRKDEIRDALKSEKSSSDSSKSARTAERNQMKEVIAPKTAKKSSHIIQTSLDEMGVDKAMLLADKVAVKKVIAGFVQGACASNKIRLAGITNVKIDEKGRVDIAISTEGEDQSVGISLPPEGEGTEPATETPEGDIAGENLDNLTGTEAVPGAEATPSATTPVPPPVGAAPAPAMASKKVQIKKVAQTPGQQDIPGAPKGGAGDQAAVPTAAPAMDEPVQSLTDGAAEGDEAGVGEADNPGQFPAGSKCPFCGSEDVDVGGKGKEPGFCNCNECGAEYLISVNVQVLNPEEMSFEETEESKAIPEPKEPELPEMPVAASINLNKDTIVKLASLEKTKGYVCPACGQTECKPVKKVAGFTACVCPACETKFEHDTMVNVDKPEEAVLKVSWTIDPKKVSTKECPSCKEGAKKFAAKVKIAKMMKKASQSEFPMANCIERLARKWGANAVSTFGPCKGKPLAECACKELSRYAISSVRKMNKLAEAMMQADPMAQCMKDHEAKGYKTAQSEIICNALKKKYATKSDENIFLMAWTDEKDLNEEDLDVMKEKSYDSAMTDAENVSASEVDENIGDPLPPVEEAGDTVTLEIPKDVAEDMKAQLDDAVEVPESVELEIEDGSPEMGSGSELEVSEEAGTPSELPKAASVMKIKLVKVAKKPTLVKEVSKEVKIPSGKATIGNEGKDNIDKKENKPKVPEGKAEMGNEGKENINPSATLPDVPRGDAYMGKEKETQKGLPANSDKIKGTVIAKEEKVTKEASTPQKVEHMETKVDAGIPRSDAKLGEESAENIDVSLAKPAIPRGDAKLGEESTENIDKPVAKVEVPTGEAYIGKEKEIQNGMPANNVETLGTVRASEEKKTKQLERLAMARHEKACVVAAKLLGEGRIKAEEMEDVVKDLSKLEIDRIESFASKIYPKMTRQASSEGATLSTAVVMESKGIEIPQEDSLKDKLSRMFTPGTNQLRDALNRMGKE